MSFLKTLSVALLVVSLAACSSRHNDQASTGSQTQSQDVSGVSTGSPAPPVDNATPMGAESAGNGGAAAAVGNSAMAGQPAPVPAGLNCGAMQPVWVNTRSHAYHEPTDPLYGRTKHGQYMCPNTAIAQGYHKASGHYRKHGGVMETQPSPEGT